LRINLKSAVILLNWQKFNWCIYFITQFV